MLYKTWSGFFITGEQSEQVEPPCFNATDFQRKEAETKNTKNLMIVFYRKSGQNWVRFGPCWTKKSGNEARRRGENFESAGS